MPGMANVKSIISAIESISEFGDTAAIKAALSWGHGPMVEVKMLWTSSRQTGGESQGRVYSAHKYNHNPPTRRFG